jgi:hypothetical protein
MNAMNEYFVQAREIFINVMLNCCIIFHKFSINYYLYLQPISQTCYHGGDLKQRLDLWWQSVGQA